MSDAHAFSLTLMADPALEAARRVKGKARELAAQQASVTGAGLSRLCGTYVVKISLREPAPPGLLDEVDGVRILYEVTGPIRVRARR